jgi:Bacterial extracellular solute-binding protein, family 7
MPDRAGRTFRYKLGLNQPAESPTAKRMAEMAEAIERETDSGFVLDVHPESRLGPDPQMFTDLQKGTLEFYLSGATLGGVAPSSALPLLPFAFKSSKSVCTPFATRCKTVFITSPPAPARSRPPPILWGSRSVRRAARSLPISSRPYAPKPGWCRLAACTRR